MTVIEFFFIEQKLKGKQKLSGLLFIDSHRWCAYDWREILY